jgi:GDP-L-fucose synthase
MINILVTGSSGLVGKALSNILDQFQINNDIHINLIGLVSKDANLCNYETSFKYIQNMHLVHSIDGIIHLAANVGGLFKNMSYPVEMIESNLFMNTNILKIAHELNINNVIMCLSTCIFPDSVKSYPITIEDLHKGPPHFSNEGYAYAKRLCDSLTRAYQKQYNRRYFCVVPTNIYGPHDNFDLNNLNSLKTNI